MSKNDLPKMGDETVSINLLVGGWNDYRNVPSFFLKRGIVIYRTGICLRVFHIYYTNKCFCKHVALFFSFLSNQIWSLISLSSMPRGFTQYLQLVIRYTIQSPSRSAAESSRVFSTSLQSDNPQHSIGRGKQPISCWRKKVRSLGNKAGKFNANSARKIYFDIPVIRQCAIEWRYVLAEIKVCRPRFCFTPLLAVREGLHFLFGRSEVNYG